MSISKNAVSLTANSAGIPGNADSFLAYVMGDYSANLWAASGFSSDGKSIIFDSDASNILASDTNGKEDIFIKTLATGAVTLVTVTAGGVQINGDVLIYGPDAIHFVLLENTQFSNLTAANFMHVYGGFAQVHPHAKHRHD